MNPIKSILVAYDFSECSKKAVIAAANLANKLNAQVSLVHVLDADISEVFAAPLTSDWREKVLQNVHKDIQAYEESADTRINIKDATVEMGIPYKKIIKKGMDLGVDLIVVGSHGRTHLGYALLGSVADKVARFSHVPVMICRMERNKAMDKILVPLDESEESEISIDYAKNFAELYHAEIQLMHAIDVHEYYYTEYKHVLAKAKDKEVDRLHALNKKFGLTLEPVVVEGGASHSIIHTVKEDEKIGLVVMMTHGSKGLKQFFLGRTTEAVARYANCHLLTIPTKEHAEKIHSMKEHLDDNKVTMGNVLI